MVKSQPARKGVPFELAPLLSQYEGYGHLSLRVERLPARARLSKGRNNGDRTWSLTLDDLDGLLYLPPEGLTEAHTLTVRIINLDNDYGATLAVLDLPVSPGGIAALAPPDDADAELHRLRGELTALQTAVAERDAALAKAAAEAAANLEASRAA